MSKCDHASRCGPCAETDQRLAREWQDSILRHEEKRDDEARLRDALERRAEKAEGEVERLRLAMRNALCWINSESEAARVLTAALPPSSIASRSTSDSHTPEKT